MSVDKNSRAGRQMQSQGRRPASRGRRKKASPWKAVALAVFLLIAAAVGGAVYYVSHLLDLSQDVEFDIQEVMTNPNLDIETEKVQKGFWKVAVFGVDSKDGNLGKGANSDVIIICSINRETGEIKMASVYRDTYLKVGEKNPYKKINEAYARGGPEQAIKALNENLDIAVDDFVAVNWKAVADAINNLGGVDIEITNAEFKQINGYITSVVENTGVYSQHLKKPGLQHLDGVQAVAYCRLRKMDTDFQRTERQRAVINQCLEKAKKADIKVLHTVIGVCLPQVAHSFKLDDLMDLAKNVTKYYLGETTGFPFDLKTQNVGKMDCVVPVTLSSNVVKLHQFLFGTENYQPSSHVTRISEDIAYNSAKSADSGEQINQEDIEKMSESYKENADKPDEEEDAVSRETDADGESRDGEEAESEESAAEPETDEDGKIIEKPEPETDEDGRIIEKPDRETEEGEHPDSNSDEYVPEDELINDPNHAIMVPTVPGGKPGTTKPGTTGSEEATNPGTTGSEEATNPGTTGSEEATKPGTTDNGATTKPGTSDSGEPTKPGTGTKPGTADSGETTKPGTTKPGTQQTTESDEGFGPGHVNAPGSLEEEVSPGPGQSTSGPSGTVHTNRPASSVTETTAGEHGPGFTG